MHRFVSLFFLLIAMSLHAAPPRVLAWDDEIAAKKLALVSATSQVEIIGMHPSKRTFGLRLKGAGPYFIRVLDQAPTADGKPIQIQVPLTDVVKHPLILLMPDAQHPTGLRPLVIDDDMQGFAWGSYRFMNATPKDIVVQMEQKAVKVPAGWKAVDLNLGGETRGIGARVALAESIEKVLYSAVWEFDANARTLCIIVPGTDPRLGPIAFKAVPEDKIGYELDTKEEKKSTGTETSP